MTRPKVLIADDEEVLALSLLRVLYRDNDRFDVLLARNGNIAREILESQRVDVVLADLRMPGMSGTELLCWIATHSPTTRVFIMTAYEINDLEFEAQRLGCLRVVRKPFDLHEMRDRIVAALEHCQENDLKGGLSQISLPDLVQILCMNERTTALRITQGEHNALLCFERGFVTHAVFDELSGEDAFRELLRLEGGEFESLPLFEVTRRTIDRDYRELLLDAARELDERGRRSLKPPVVSSGAEPSAIEDNEKTAKHRVLDYDDLTNLGLKAMRAGNLSKAQEYWKAARALDQTARG